VQDWKRYNKCDSELIPKFHLKTTIRKWGQIQTEVISVNCAKPNAQYLKYLLSAAIEQGYLGDCIFIPI